MRVLKDGNELAEDFSITAGEWAVIKEAKPTVDQKRQQIYYLANPVSPISSAL
jgi:hypothetical protein